MSWGFLGRCCRPIPQRFVIATMLMLGMFLQFVNDLCFESGLYYMVHGGLDSDKFEDACPNNSSIAVRTSVMPEFFWTDSDEKYLEEAFWICYAITQLPGGLLSDLYGPKRVMVVGIFISGICSLLTPLCVRLTDTIWVLMIVRMFMGLAQGPMHPAASSFIARWYIPKERNLASAYKRLSMYLSMVYTHKCIQYLFLNLDSWESIFYIHGILTIALSIPWYLFIFDNPTKHPFITEVERDKINSGLRGQKTVYRHRIPMNDILKSRPVWALILCAIAFVNTSYVLSYTLPTFAYYYIGVEVLGHSLTVTQTYVIISTCNISIALSAEFILKKRWISRTNQCKLWTVVAIIVPGVFILLTAFGGCNPDNAGIFYILAEVFMGFGVSSIDTVNVHMAPNFAGLLMGLTNTLGHIVLEFQQSLNSFCLEQETGTCMKYLLLLYVVMACLTPLFFVKYGLAELQEWNDPTVTIEPGEDENSLAE